MTDTPVCHHVRPLLPRIEVFPTGWNTALERGWKVRVETDTSLELVLPRVVSVRVRPLALRVNSYAFSDRWASPPLTDTKAGTASSAGTAAVDKPGRRMTRIRPPEDVVTLRDRLYYVLQPPLELLVSRGEISFPFEPFAYQWEGVAFLFPRYAAILADEMGLGKTMQAITAIRLLLRAGEVSSVLLVCPKPLVSNWKREFTLWAPEIPVGIIEGEPVRRRWQWLQNHTPVKLANYEVLMRDRDLLGASGPHFDLVVLDEAQRIKNRSSSTSEVVRAIRRTRSWALTGTPVENTPEDLVGIFEFLAPGYLRPGMDVRRLSELSRDYIIRRTKDMVLEDLPPKIIRDAELTLTPEQSESYHIAERQGVLRLNSLGDQITIQHVFELILRLKQICNYDPVTGASSKLERLLADMEEVASSGKKAIVFSQWVGTIQFLRERLANFSPLEYHGRIPARERDAILQRFRENPQHHVLLMSYGAGSVGINLQFCQYVFLFDRWWNPAVEDQAINRAHRIGSAGPVIITRMLSADTVEQRINNILEEKRKLFATMFSNTYDPKSLSLTQEEIFSLFRLQVPSKQARKVG
jgi:SNF2 family DNA or RNA helicase